MGRNWITGHAAYTCARAEAQNLADRASRPVLMWQIDRKPATFIVDVVPELWAAFSRGWLVLPKQPRVTYRAQIEKLLHDVRAALSRRDPGRPVGEEPEATLVALVDVLKRLLKHTPRLVAFKDEVLPVTSYDVAVDDEGDFRLTVGLEKSRPATP